MGPEENDWNLADDIFQYNLLTENDFILILISVKFIPKSPIGIKSIRLYNSWVPWGDKPLSEPMVPKIYKVI